MDKSVVDILPARNVLTGSDSTSKIGTKSAAFQAVIKCGYELLHLFGKSEIFNEMILLEEKGLVECISKCSARNNGHHVRFETYRQKLFELDLEQLPPTMSSIHIHIKRAFLQCYLWLHALFVEFIEINPANYGYELTEVVMLVPTIYSKDVIPDDFLVPCNYLKFVKKNVCLCLVKLISCCRFCKCKASLSYNNTFTIRQEIFAASKFRG